MMTLTLTPREIDLLTEAVLFTIHFRGDDNAVEQISNHGKQYSAVLDKILRLRNTAIPSG